MVGLGVTLVITIQNLLSIMTAQGLPRLSSQAATILSLPVSFMNYGLLLSFHRDDIVFDLFVFSICCCFF